MMFMGDKVEHSLKMTHLFWWLSENEDFKVIASEARQSTFLDTWIASSQTLLAMTKYIFGQAQQVVGSIFFFLLSSLLFALPLTDTDYKNLQKQKRVETLVYEVCKPQQIPEFSMLGVQFDRFLTDNLYLGGSAYGAVSGGRGGYALGSFNLGYVWNLSQDFFVDGKLMLGGSGGGGVPVKGGLMIQPMLSIGYQFGKEVQLRIGYGQFIALDSDYRAEIFNIGISFITQHLFLPIY
ncbi:MAG: hypothetical protein PHV30_09445 [Candidatus Margulisbacteria bacterium]|nr:hypothetical protein [Candidatus Margulisiibacteriota bacterium]